MAWQDIDRALAVLPEEDEDGLPVDLAAPEVSSRVAGSVAVDPAVAKAREERDSEVALANMMQGITQIGTALGSQGRAKVDTSTFDALRDVANKKVDETSKDVLANRKLVSEYLQKKAAEDRYKSSEEWRKKNYELEERKTKAAEKSAGIARQDKINEKEEKKKASLNEVEERKRNIEDNITLLEKMITDKGTYELFGSHNQDLERLVDQVATDMAKLQDPGSVARPNEVDMVKRNLVGSGMFKRDSTALDILKNFRKEVQNRANTAYKVRGLTPPSSRPKTVIQNGHTYTWNDEKGRYE